MATQPLIMLVAGETSGDLLGSQLVRAARAQQPTARFVGVGGPAMATAGVELLFSSDALAVMGVIEVLRKFGQLRACMQRITDFLEQTRPALLILIDYPGFNLRLAARAKAMGIKVLYYVSPQIWAWHYSRIKKIRRNVDHMAVLFPFEANMYAREGVPATFVGHPLAANTQPSMTRADSYAHYQLDPLRPTLALLPGSRPQEIERLLPIMLTAVKMLRQRFPDLQVILPLAPSITPASLAAYALDDVTLIADGLLNALQLCDAAIVTSGTVTLDVALQGVPMVVIYQVNRVTAMIGRCFGKLRAMEQGKANFALCNIVAEQRLVPELLQRALTPEAIVEQINVWLTQPEQASALRTQLQQLGEHLQGPQAAEQVARLALQLAEPRGTASH